MGAIRLLAVLSGAALACQSSSSGGLSSIAAEIGPEGGTLTASDGTRVDVPAGALPAPAMLTLEPATGAQPPAGAAFISPPWTLQPDWLQFAQPIAVTFPIDRTALDAGAIIVTTAQATSGYLALAATAVDATHVATRSTHFATGGAAAASCPASCTTSVDPVGQTLRCSTSCIGHSYVLSCSGPVGAAASCSCIVDGVVASAMTSDTGDGGAGRQLYTAQCGFPSSSWTGGM